MLRSRRSRTESDATAGRFGQCQEPTVGLDAVRVVDMEQPASTHDGGSLLAVPQAARGRPASDRRSDQVFWPA